MRWDMRYAVGDQWQFVSLREKHSKAPQLGRTGGKEAEAPRSPCKEGLERGRQGGPPNHRVKACTIVLAHKGAVEAGAGFYRFPQPWTGGRLLTCRPHISGVWEVERGAGDQALGNENSCHTLSIYCVPCSSALSFIFSCNPRDNVTRQGLLAPKSRQGNQSPEKVRDLPRTPRTCVLSHTTVCFCYRHSHEQSHYRDPGAKASPSIQLGTLGPL